MIICWLHNKSKIMNHFEFIKKEKFIFSIIFFGGVVFFILAVFFLWNEHDLTLSEKINSEKFGQFGDFVGGVIGSFWALAGIFLFYKALTEQREDFSNNKETLILQVNALNQQIDEFKLTRKEQKLSRKVYEEQSKTLKIQQFESNFYSLLNVYINIKNDLNKDNEYFKLISNKISHPYNEHESYIVQHEKTVSNYISVYNDERERLSDYFRSLYRMLQIIDSSPNLNKEEKVFYSKILRAQMSDYELVIINYNSHTYFGEKVRRFILKYNLLKHLPVFCKSDFSYFSNLQENSSLFIFTKELDRFLIKHVHNFYNVESEVDKIEENFESFNVIVGIYFDDNINIRIYCDDDISKNGIDLNEKDFSFFIERFLYERLITNSYLKSNSACFISSVIKDNEKCMFNIVIESESLLKINQDMVGEL